MAHRVFRDAQGNRWEAWEVRPTLAERGIRGMQMNDELRQGWLAFQGATERRRITPIPERWSFMSDGELRNVLARARTLEDRLFPPEKAG